MREGVLLCQRNLQHPIRVKSLHHIHDGDEPDALGLDHLDLLLRLRGQIHLQLWSQQRAELHKTRQGAVCCLFIGFHFITLTS